MPGRRHRARHGLRPPSLTGSGCGPRRRPQGCRHDRRSHGRDLPAARQGPGRTATRRMVLICKLASHAVPCGLRGQPRGKAGRLQAHWLRQGLPLLPGTRWEIRPETRFPPRCVAAGDHDLGTVQRVAPSDIERQNSVVDTSQPGLEESRVPTTDESCAECASTDKQTGTFRNGAHRSPTIGGAERARPTRAEPLSQNRPNR